MVKKWPGEWPQPHEFSPLYREKKARIQEANYYEFIEFLNWIENVNKWKKKEDGKRLVDEWFNKYSDWAIVWLFDRFVNFKKSKWQVSYEKILNEAKSAFRTEIYGENIVRPLFGYYGNYLKYLKKKRIESEIRETVGSKTEKADEVKKEKKQEVAEILEAKDGESEENPKIDEKENFVDEWAENHYGWNDRDVMNEDWDVVFNPEHEHVSLDSESEDYSVEVGKDGQLKFVFKFDD